MFSSPRFLALPLALAALGATAFALEDAPPVDLNTILQTLSSMREKQTTQSKAIRQRAISDATSAAGNPSRAVELWEEAIRATQFQGAAKESAQFRAWKESEGDALKEKEVLNALRLYFNWLAITLQRGNGVEVKDMLPAIMSHAHEAMADQTMMDAFEDNLKKEQEDAKGGAGVGGGNKKANANANAREREKRNNNQQVKKMHDTIALRPLASSVYAEWLRLDQVIADVAPPPARRGGGQGEGKRGQGGGQGNAATPAGSAGAWEGVPANVDGLYNNIILPALREARDPHVVEYIDYRLRREAEVATRTKLTFEVDKFNQIRRPQLLWQRSQEVAGIGLKNRAAGEMFALIKANPNHPDNRAWIEELEGLLAPPPPAPAPQPASASAAPSR